MVIHKISEITEVCVVVNDIQRTMEAYWNILGLGPWKVYLYAPPVLVETTLRGELVDYSMKLATTMIGNLQLELVEPLKGPSIYKEFLKEKGEGLHHISSYQYKSTQEVNEALQQFKSIGIGVLMSGKVFDSEYYYMDTEETLGVIYEINKLGKEPDYYAYPSERIKKNSLQLNQTRKAR